MFSAETLTHAGLNLQEAVSWAGELNELSQTTPPDRVWAEFLSHVDCPKTPLEPIRVVLNELRQQWDPSSGPFPVWQPDEASLRESNLAKVMNQRGLTDYEAFHRWSVSAKEEFWAMVVQRLGIEFAEPYEAVLRESGVRGQFEFFPGARLNISQSCFQADETKDAIKFRDFDGADHAWTYGQLQKLVISIARSLDRLGLKPSDRVAIDMPMTAESVAIYLAIVRSGMAVVSVADSFAPDEIATRLRSSDTKLVFTQDVIPRAGKTLPLYDKVVQANAPQTVVIAAHDSLQVQLRDGDLDWDEFLSHQGDDHGIVITDTEAVTNVLFSSGTTGDPKSIPWTQLTPIKAAMDSHFHQDVHPEDVVAWPTNLGWVMGPWLIYSGLINRATIALYYGAPTERGFGEFVSDAKVSMLGLVPSLVKSWKPAKTMEGLDWSSVRLISSTGECSNPDDYLYLMWLCGFRPVIEYCGGTELGGGYLASTVLQPNAPSVFTTAGLGTQFWICDESGAETEIGEVFLDPVSVGFSKRLLNRDHDQVYFEGCPLDPHGRPTRRHGDELQRDGKFYRALGRADDAMNLGGIKISSAEIERVVSNVDGLQEVAAVAVPPPEGGPSELVVYAVPARSDIDREATEAEMRLRIREELNPLFKLRELRLIEQLPRTASNKVMRRMLRSLDVD